MQRDFWQGRWDEGRLGWHIDGPNPILVEHIGRLTGGQPARVLMPLCGKSHDLVWLEQNGHRPVGIEMIERAVDDLFGAAGIADVSSGDRDRRIGGGIEMLIADIFELTADDVGAIDAVWDRGALIALPPDRRLAYRDKIAELAPGAPILLSAVDYDPEVMSGPPWPITPAQVESLYPEAECLANTDIIDRSPRWREVGHSWFHSLVYLISSF